MPHSRLALATLLLTLAIPCAAQDPEEKPLPDISTLMRQVEANQRTAETLARNYIYRESSGFDVLDSHEGVKRTTTHDFEISWINGVQIRRIVSINGKPLPPDELAKQNAHIDEVVKKSKERRDKADAEGKETDSHGRDEITFSRILELGAFSNPRRQQVAGRDTILVDYQGDPKAKTRNTADGVFKELAGTIWVDEQDRTVQHLEAHFDHNFKVVGGLLVSVHEGTWFKATFRKINDEVWLPETIEGDGHARYLLFFSLNGHFTGRDSDYYRKFNASSTVLPDFNSVPDPTPEAPPPTTLTPPTPPTLPTPPK